ncbi:retrieval of early ER protein Rer1 [Russula brevipes]|nr:retrieval of early ER protein Rer1 [Russula brevipes]
MSSSEATGETSASLQNIPATYARLKRQYQQTLDRITPHIFSRWVGTTVTIAIFELRILYAQGWYIDAHAIYLLNLLLAFLQPNDTPSPLPSTRDDEFRPFVRRLPEWQFWLSTTRATLISFFMTFSAVFDVPVYWPILVMYFCVLFVLTMRRQLQHMIKYRYVPFDWGRKTRYGATGK